MLERIRYHVLNNVIINIITMKMTQLVIVNPGAYFSPFSLIPEDKIKVVKKEEKRVDINLYL